ncbi:MAG: antibiotic biosynthesis monooxygenase [Pseudonocardiaceae bacterium]
MFTVEPARQQELVALPVVATEEIMQHQPCFISANIHASADGERIVNYSQRESEQAFQAMRANPQVLKHIADHHRQIDVEETLFIRTRVRDGSGWPPWQPPGRGVRP